MFVRFRLIFRIVHVLNKINDIKSAGESLLVTMDVESLYTNIDHVEGLEAVEHFLSDRSPESVPPTTFIDGVDP